MQNNETPPDNSAATDQWWHPDRFEERADALVRRADMVKSLREFFDRRGYVEVDTPALQVSPGMEPHLTAFETSLGEPGGGRRPVYLHTSPEFAMKKLLAAGMQRIFQLARVFRDGERTARHHPEFTMLEWYRTGAGWRDIAEEAAAFVRASCGPVVQRGDVQLGVGTATVLHSYPASLAALARLSPEDGRVSDRFEIFICGLELANGYGELTDAAEQRRRFETMTQQRVAEGRAPYPVDEDFLAALESGIPDCAGIALGFDRLVMLAAGAERIDDVLWAPVAGG